MKKRQKHGFCKARIKWRMKEPSSVGASDNAFVRVPEKPKWLPEEIIELYDGRRKITGTLSDLLGRASAKSSHT